MHTVRELSLQRRAIPAHRRESPFAELSRRVLLRLHQQNRTRICDDPIRDRAHDRETLHQLSPAHDDHLFDRRIADRVADPPLPAVELQIARRRRILGRENDVLLAPLSQIQPSVNLEYFAEFLKERRWIRETDLLKLLDRHATF